MNDVVELRQYTLRPGQRDVLIELFDREFVESQEAAGMRILGQFRDLDRPDHFVWLRSFPDMPTRKDALTSFYTGSAWQANSAAANATMIDSDDVLLLRPAGRGPVFDLTTAVRDTPASSLVSATVYALPTPADDALVDYFAGTLVPLLAAAGGTPLALLTTEYAENTFPQLPIRAGEHVLVLLSSFAGREAHAEHEQRLADLPEWAEIQPRLPPVGARLLLAPTDRSMLR